MYVKILSIREMLQKIYFEFCDFLTIYNGIHVCKIFEKDLSIKYQNNHQKWHIFRNIYCFSREKMLDFIFYFPNKNNLWIKQYQSMFDFVFRETTEWDDKDPGL